MRTETALTWSWLNVLTKTRYDALLKVYSSLDDALERVQPETLKALGLREETIQKTMNRLEEFNPLSYQQELEKRGIHLLSWEDASYPATLKTIADPPVFLYSKGDLSILDQPCIALVGSREMTAYGKRVVEAFVPAIVKAGCITVSGLAMGIDETVAIETISASGRTVAVFGHGFGTMYPKSATTHAEEIVAKGGLLLSEFPLDTQPDKHTFPARNRIIAGLSLATVVLEAGEESGSLITADLALEYGREVFAVPGQIFDPSYAGCHLLLSKGHAKLLTNPSDLLRDIGIVESVSSSSRIVYEPQNKEEEAILSILTTMPKPVGELVEKSGLETGTLNAALTMMELSGVVKNINGAWVRA